VNSGWFRISRSNLDTVTTSPYLCMLTHFLYASSYCHLLFWIHSRFSWLSRLVRLILISFSYSSHLMSLLPCQCCIHFSFRRLALTLLISRCWKHLITIRITDGFGTLTPEDIVSPCFCETINLHPSLVVMPNTKSLHEVCMVKKKTSKETND